MQLRNSIEYEEVIDIVIRLPNKHRSQRTEYKRATVPGQDLYGELPGYLSKNKNSFCWLVTSVKIEGPTAYLAMINDYGSEDLTASLTIKDDSIYVLRQEDGSTLKVPKNGKWQKLPKTLEFKRR